MSTVPNEVLNDLFAQRLDSHAETEKLAALGGDWIRDRLREESFTRKILPPKTVTRADLQVSTQHDTLVKIVEIEPDSKAMTMAFRGEPTAKYIEGKRFEVPFHTVGSERYEKTEEELMAYTMSIVEVIKKNVVMDIQEVEDHTFLTHCEAAVQSLQKEANSVAFTAQFNDTTSCTAFNVIAGTCVEVSKVKANDVIFQSAAANAAAGVIESLEVPLQKDDLAKLFKTFPGDGGRGSRLKADRFLISDTDFEDISTWTSSDVADMAEGTTVEGFKGNKLLGRSYIRTLKTDILRPGNIYAYAEPKYFGGFMILNKTKFYADKRRNRISWEAWETIGMYIGNVAGVRKLELYAASSDDKSGTSNATILTARAPKDEADLGQRNNLVTEGQTFPSVSGF